MCNAQSEGPLTLRMVRKYKGPDTDKKRESNVLIVTNNSRVTYGHTIYRVYLRKKIKRVVTVKIGTKCLFFRL